MLDKLEQALAAYSAALDLAVTPEAQRSAAARMALVFNEQGACACSCPAHVFQCSC